jgi:RNA polymerase sigma-70 factor (ECF subfamily)
MDEGRFTALYLAHAEWLTRYVGRIIRDADAARDIVHDTLLKALEGPASTAPAAWLRSVAHNASLDYLRRQRRITLEDPSVVERRRDREEPRRRWGASRSIHDALGAVPTSQQQVMVLRFAYGLPPAEVGTVLGKSPAAVRQTESRALQALRAALNPESCLEGDTRRAAA